MAFFVTIPACNAADKPKRIDVVAYKNNIAIDALQEIKKTLNNDKSQSKKLIMINLLSHKNLEINDSSEISLTLKEKLDYLSNALDFYQSDILKVNLTADKKNILFDDEDLEAVFHGLHGFLIGMVNGHPLDLSETIYESNDPVVKSMLRCIFLMGRMLNDLHNRKNKNWNILGIFNDKNKSFLERFKSIRNYWKQAISKNEDKYKLQEAYLTALILHAAGLKDGLNTHLNEMKEEGFETSKLSAFIDNDPSGFLITTMIDDEPRPLLATLNEDLKELGPKLIQLKPELFFQ